MLSCRAVSHEGSFSKPRGKEVNKILDDEIPKWTQQKPKLWSCSKLNLYTNCVAFEKSVTFSEEINVLSFSL